MEMRLVPSTHFLFFSTLSSALQAIVHRARRLSRVQSSTGIVAIHNGTKMYMTFSFSRSMGIIVHGANVLLRRFIEVVVITGLCFE